MPNLAINLGAGSLAGYLNCTPQIAEDTIWFEERNLDSYQEIINQHLDGMATWMDVWLPGSGSDVQCDFS